MLKYLNTKQASRFLKVSENTLRNWDKKGKLVPEKTSGGHRRYKSDDLILFNSNRPLKKDRSLNQDTSYVKNEIFKKWNKNNYLDECKNKKEKEDLASILEVVSASFLSSYDENFPFEFKDFLELTKLTWNKIKFKRFINISTMSGPVGLVDGTDPDRDVIVAAIDKLNFNIFDEKYEFDKVKELYSSAFAAQFDLIIYKILMKDESRKISLDILLDHLDGNNDLINIEDVDYLIIPSKYYNVLIKYDVLKNIDLIKYDNIMDDKLGFFCIKGKYKLNPYKPPYFCPYVLLSLTPRLEGSIRFVFSRYAVYDKQD